MRSLTGQSNNGVPVISNREYKGSINLKDGEPAVVAGEVSETDTRSMSGIPGLGFFPSNQVMVNNTKKNESDELMIIITPHVSGQLRSGHAGDLGQREIEEQASSFGLPQFLCLELPSLFAGRREPPSAPTFLVFAANSTRLL